MSIARGARGRGDRRSGRGDGHRADQDGRAVAIGSMSTKCSPAAADGELGGGSRYPGPQCARRRAAAATVLRGAAGVSARSWTRLADRERSRTMNRLVDRGDLPRAYVIGAWPPRSSPDFTLIIPIEMDDLAARAYRVVADRLLRQPALDPGGPGPWRRDLMNGLFSRLVTGLSTVGSVLVDQNALLLRRRRLSRPGLGGTIACWPAPMRPQRYLEAGAAPAVAAGVTESAPGFAGFYWRERRERRSWCCPDGARAARRRWCFAACSARRAPVREL